MRRAAAALAVLLFLAGPLAGEEPQRVPLRVGTHADHGRLVFDWPQEVGYEATREGDRVLLRFLAPGRFDLSAGRRTTRNLVAVAEEDGAVVIRTAPGARLRHFRLGSRVVVDLLDPTSPAGAPDAPAVPAAEARPPALTTARAEAPTTRPPRDVPAAAAPEPSPPTPVPPIATAPPLPAAPSAAAQSPPPLPVPDAALVRLLRDRPGVLVPAEDGVGLALLRRGANVLAVMDRPLRLDLAPLRGHPTFGGLDVVATPDATLLVFPLPAQARLFARREGAAWAIEATLEPDARETSVLRATPDRGPPARLALQGPLPRDGAGGVVAVTDPDSGEALVVATLRGAGPGVALGRRLPEFDLLPTMMGAAVLARSDRIVLRGLPDRLVVEAGGGGVSLGAASGPEPPARAQALTRLLDLPAAEVPALLERLRLQLTGINEAPPLTRGPMRRDAAETLLALGLPQEAQAMAGLALREDPRARDDPRLLLAQGAAALLSGRPADARGIADPRLPPVDEVALWRALLATAEGRPDAALALAAGVPLLLAYPEALRTRLLPMALEAMAMGGATMQAARLLVEAAQLPDLDLVRALVAEDQGRVAEALAGYEAVARGRDRRRRAIAMRQAAELRRAGGMIDAAGAADALERALFAWRGGAQELALRRRIAALRLEAGQAVAAFQLLEETARFFPDQAPQIRPDLTDAFAAALAAAPPTLATTLYDAHPDLLPAGERGEATVLVLADRLAALDLSQRAAALLEGATGRATPEARAGIGARLATMRLDSGDAAGALAALDGTAAAGLPGALANRRTLLRARALARRGQRDEAQALFADLGPAGAEPRAELSAEAQDWAGAATAQMEHVGAIVPVAPAELDQSQRAALARAAAYAALAGDEALLATLRAGYEARMAGGPLAEAFALLTGDPVRGAADLPRLQREIGMLRLLPARLEALRGGVQVAR